MVSEESRTEINNNGIDFITAGNKNKSKQKGKQMILKSLTLPLATPPKRFYKTTNVLSTDSGYEVTLDHRKLKTPNGTLFTVKSEPLAIAVATEFDAQKEHIERSRMHISALCFTAIDNPNRLTKPDMVNYLLNFIATDTVLFQYDVSYSIVDR